MIGVGLGKEMGLTIEERGLFVGKFEETADNGA